MAASVTVHSNAHYFPIFQPILMNLASKSMIHRALNLNLNLNRLLVKRQIDNPSPGAVTGGN